MANPFPTPVPADSVMRVNVLFGTYDAGWSESHYIRVNGPGGNYELAKQWVLAYRAARVAGMSVNAKFVVARVGPADGKGMIELVGAEDVTPNKGQIAGHSTSAEVGWQLDLFDETGRFKGRHTLRGFSDDWNRDMMKEGMLGTSRKPDIVAYMKSLDSLISKPWTTKDGGSVQGCLRVIAKDPAKWVTVKTTGYGQDSNGRLTATISGDLDPQQWSIGDVVSLHHRRTRCVSGINGQHIIANVVISQGVTTVSFQDKLCCYDSKIGTMAGEMRKRGYEYYLITKTLQSRAATRDLGRPFDPSPGHRSRCCK